jgi:hypothetical protein
MTSLSCELAPTSVRRNSTFTRAATLAQTGLGHGRPFSAVKPRRLDPTAPGPQSSWVQSAVVQRLALKLYYHSDCFRNSNETNELAKHCNGKQ